MKEIPPERARRLALLTIARLAKEGILRHTEPWGFHPETYRQLDVPEEYEAVEHAAWKIIRELRKSARELRKTRKKTAPPIPKHSKHSKRASST